MNSLLDPAIMFFVFGIFAGIVKSNLEIPAAISRFLSLYLLMALGLKGGFALSHSGFTAEVGTGLGIAIALALVVPLAGYHLLKHVVSEFDAVAISATYGSVSAVTFVTTVQYLENQHISYGGHMAAAMALMESPAIIMAVIMANTLRQRVSKNSLLISSNASTLMIEPNIHEFPLIKIFHESFTDGAQLLLLGSMVVGLITGDSGKTAMQPFSGDLFKGMLSFFLLDMGLMVARNITKVRGQSPWLLTYSVFGPLTHASIALLISWAFKISQGDTTLLMVLAASASYIAVPAVLRFAIPEANPSLYFVLSLGVTFPINILIGIPFYTKVASVVIGFT